MTINRAAAAAILAATPAAAQLDADAARRAATRTAPYTAGQAIQITRDGTTSVHTVRTITSKGDYWTVGTTAGRFNVNHNGSSRRPGTEVTTHTPAAPSAPAPRGWSRYSRPQGICQYCGAPCADTPSPTCTDC